MKTIIIFLNMMFLSICIQAQINRESIELQVLYPEELLNGDIFHIDDSLLYTNHPLVKEKKSTVAEKRSIFTHEQILNFTPKDSSIFKNLLIITPAITYNNLSYEIRRYAEDVHTVCGYGIYLETISNSTPEDLRNVIIEYGNKLCGVFFIGDVSECLFEIANDYNKYGYRKWPCDLFFMDIDGTWEDEDNNGIYDKHSGNVAPELFMGRLSAVGMSSLGDKMELLRMQLNKSHLFWWEESYHSSDTVLNYIDKDWNDIFSKSEISPIFSSNEVVDVRYGIDTIFSPTDYLSKLSSSCYGFTHLAAHSSPTLHHLTNGYVYLSDLKNNTSNNYAYNLFCCSACNWTLASSQGFLGGVYLFNGGKTTTVIGSTKTGSMLGTNYFYSYLTNKNVGEAYLSWWKRYNGNSHSETEIHWSYGMTILGDPTINLRHEVRNFCESELTLNSFPDDNQSNLIMYKAAQSIYVSGQFIIPEGVHVIFDAPEVVFGDNFSCPIGASFETRNEGCKL